MKEQIDSTTELFNRYIGELNNSISENTKQNANKNTIQDVIDSCVE
jgi:hypothetical protein